MSKVEQKVWDKSRAVSTLRIKCFLQPFLKTQNLGLTKTEEGTSDIPHEHKCGENWKKAIDKKIIGYDGDLLDNETMEELTCGIEIKTSKSKCWTTTMKIRDYARFDDKLVIFFVCADEKDKDSKELGIKRFALILKKDCVITNTITNPETLKLMNSSAPVHVLSLKKSTCIYEDKEITLLNKNNIYGAVSKIFRMRILNFLKKNKVLIEEKNV